jgi:hypothetical protein
MEPGNMLQLIRFGDISTDVGVLVHKKMMECDNYAIRTFSQTPVHVKQT